MSDPPNRSFFSHYADSNDDPYDGYEEYDDVLPNEDDQNEEDEYEEEFEEETEDEKDSNENEDDDDDAWDEDDDDDDWEEADTEDDDFVSEPTIEPTLEKATQHKPASYFIHETVDKKQEQSETEEAVEPPEKDAWHRNQTNETEKTILSVENVSVRFDNVDVLRNIDFSVQEGETVAIIGESGCGKTVMLKTLINLFKPSRGRVRFDGYDLAELSYFDLANIRTRYGYVFQQAALFDSLTIGNNIAFPLIEHTKKTKKEIDDIVFRLLHEVGLSEETYFKKPAELSGGMRKRVGFARALALEPEMMLYDEPTTGLDPIMSDVINELIIKTHTQHNVTSVMVTHDMKSACKVADRIIMLYPLNRLDENENQIIFDGTPEELEESEDVRVWQFLHGVAGDRLQEMENG